MLGIRKYFIGLVIGLVAGLWAGVNIGKGQPVWANPFAEVSLAEKAKETAGDVWKDAKKAARDTLSD
jgi:hypothetical protein